MIIVVDKMQIHNAMCGQTEVLFTVKSASILGEKMYAHGCDWLD